MILSKQSLQAVTIAAKDKQIQGLDNLHVTATGSSIAANRNCVVACSPVPADIKKELPVSDSGSCPAVTFSTETARQIIGAIPTDSMFKGRLEFFDLKELSDHEIQFTTHDGKRKKTIEARKYNGKYIPFAEIISRVLSKREKAARCILNRSRLKLLLEVMDKICGDVSSGEAPAFMEFCACGDIIVRGVNQKTGQRAMAVMTAYEAGEWLEPDSWEKELSGTPETPAPKKIAVRRNV